MAKRKERQQYLGQQHKQVCSAWVWTISQSPFENHSKNVDICTFLCHGKKIFLKLKAV